MTREQYLDILLLVSTLESMIIAHKVPVPDHLFDALSKAVELLRREIINAPKQPAA